MATGEHRHGVALESGHIGMTPIGTDRNVLGNRHRPPPRAAGNPSLVNAAKRSAQLDNPPRRVATGLRKPRDSERHYGDNERERYPPAI